MKTKVFSLDRVRITGGPLKHAMELNKDYLLELEPDRLLSRFREYAGLPVKAANYKGWEDLGISGHSLGHYLSACAMMAASTSDKRFFERVDYIVGELEICQIAHGDGYVSGIPRGKELFNELRVGDIRSQGFDLNGGWVPFYTLHKLFAGLRDAYRVAGNKKAIIVEEKLGLWLEGILSELNEDQIQEILKCEFGGMSEVLADLAVDTGAERFWRLSEQFHHHKFLNPLSEGRDELAGKHANTQIPKVIGAARQYEVSRKQPYRDISEFFWSQVVHHHSYVIGGNSLNEHFGEPGELSDRLGANTCETCNSYNMLKLTKHLFQWNALAEEGDFYERVLYNHILASQHPVDGRVTYFVSLDMGGHKSYNSKFDDFTCCVGSGMENHSNYGNAIYFHGDRSLYVSQYIPSQLDWRELGVSVNQTTLFPEQGSVKLEFNCCGPTSFSLSLRYPYWAESGMEIKVNGVPYHHGGIPSSFITIERLWQNGDFVEITIPMTLRKEEIKGNPNRVALMYGPLVLAGDLGPANNEENVTDLLYTPVLVTDDTSFLDDVHLVEGKLNTFATSGLGYPRDVELYPFYRLHDHNFTVYWDVFTMKEWKKAELSYKNSIEKERDLQLKTVDFVQPGEMQPERDHGFEGEHVGFGILSNRKYRDTWPGGYFSFVLHVQPSQQNYLIVTYTKEIETINQFDLTIDGFKLDNGIIENEEMDRFVLIRYEIPSEATQSKQKVKVKFSAHHGAKVPKVFGIRVIKEQTSVVAR